MAKFINTTGSKLIFGRFKVGANEAVPAVEYTDIEQKDIERFITKGILKSDDSTPVVEEAKVEPEVETPVEAKVEEESESTGKSTAKKK